MFKIICLKLLSIYQKFISPLKSSVCRFYPSCSEYAYWQFQKKNFFSAFFLTFFRILRCNPFFKGGFDYPKIKKKIISCNFCFKPIYLVRKKFHYFYIPYNDKVFYLVKYIKKDK
ncbi:membrane protein insertion efficiency factor YidD [Campylobacter estrildidarum]|uniref:Putative membrane protein insertion efficiency factor n=1 Tax=Campylobacter estrildidarum TaxID=2510189 RepID=A0A4U7BKC2_9BACT|nr:membrane protein insertion efficiency factor YidD [Campylobacter estrildidarum]TKX30685.1 membrane protein insertion efficiency factor YidD [Campylobacter estrildidarum]